MDEGMQMRSELGRTARRVLLRTAGVLALGTLVGCSPMDDLLVSIFGRSMREQPSFNPYENPQPPPVGSVPFASGNFPPSPGMVALGQAEGTPVPPPIQAGDLLRALSDPEAVPAVSGLENPIPADESSLERGRAMFERACVPCHGPTGDGSGPVTQAGVPPIPIVEGQALGLSPSYIYSIIRAGRGAMPAYGHQITHFDRWHLVNYVLQLQGRTPPEGGADGADPGSPEN